MKSLKNKKKAILILVVAIILIAFVFALPRLATTLPFSNSFENGYDAWGTNTSDDGLIEVSDAKSYDGTYSSHADFISGTGYDFAYCYVTFNPQTTVYVEFRINFAALPPSGSYGTQIFFSLGVTASDIICSLELYRELSDVELRFRRAYPDDVRTSWVWADVTTNTWYHFKVKFVSATAGEYRVWLNTNEITALTQTNFDTSAAEASRLNLGLVNGITWALSSHPNGENYVDSVMIYTGNGFPPNGNGSVGEVTIDYCTFLWDETSETVTVSYGLTNTGDLFMYTWVRVAVLGEFADYYDQLDIGESLTDDKDYSLPMYGTISVSFYKSEDSYDYFQINGVYEYTAIPEETPQGTLRVFAYYDGAEVAAQVTVGDIGSGTTPWELLVDPNTYTIVCSYLGKNQTKNQSVGPAETREVKFYFTSELTTGILQVEAKLKNGTSVEVDCSIEGTNVNETYVTPFSVELNEGDYDLTCWYEHQKRTKTVEINVDETSEVVFEFSMEIVSPPMEEKEGKEGMNWNLIVALVLMIAIGISVTYHYRRKLKS